MRQARQKSETTKHTKHTKGKRSRDGCPCAALAPGTWSVVSSPFRVFRVFRDSIDRKNGTTKHTKHTKGEKLTDERFSSRSCPLGSTRSNKVANRLISLSCFSCISWFHHLAPFPTERAEMDARTESRSL